VLGPGALDDLIARLDAHAAEMLGHGRTLFERWLDDVAGSRNLAHGARDRGEASKPAL
jgi:hypothetical protein